jgi:hypothetical protein
MEQLGRQPSGPSNAKGYRDAELCHVQIFALHAKAFPFLGKWHVYGEIHPQKLGLTFVAV